MYVTPRRVRRTRGLSLVVLALVAILLTACGSGGGKGSAGTSHAVIADWGGILNPGGTPVRGGTLVIDQSAAPVGVSVVSMIEAPENPTQQIVAQIFDTLVEYVPGHLDPQPALARSWEVSPDGLTYTFHLRDVTFSNGMPMTSGDVKYTLDLARGPTAVFPQSYLCIAKILTPDARTVVLKLSKPSPSLIYSLGSVVTAVVPEKLVRSMGKAKFNQHPVGTGPFMLKRWVKGQEIDLVRNPRYWRKGLPYLDAVKIRATASDNTRVLNVTSGTTDVADLVPFSQIKTINSGNAARVLVVPGGDMFVVFMNNARKPFSDLAVRQALNYATPVQQINKIVFGGVAPTMNTIYPKGKYWNKDAPAYPYDIAKAKALLASSSAAKGFSATLLIIGTDQASNQVAQIVQQSWAKIGVHVTIQRTDNATLGTNWQQGDYQLVLFPPGSITTDQPIDDVMTKILFDSPETNNLFTYYKNAQAAKLTEEATSTMDDAARRRLFGELQAITMRDAPVVPMVYTPNRAAVRDDVHDFNYVFSGWWRLDTVWKS